MNPMLLSGFGNFVSVDKRKLVIVNKLENTRKEYAIRDLPFDNLIISSYTGNLSFEALRFLVKHNVMITTLSFNGDLLSVTLPNAPASAALRIRQYQAYLDQDKRYSIARAIVQQKVILQLNVLKELSRYYDLDIKAIERAFDSEEKFCNKKTIEALMTMEGRCADIYWRELIKIVNKLYPEFNFTSRNNDLNSHNRNAANPPSSLWNYAYSLCEAEAKRVINYIGFDSSVSYLHSIEQDGRQNFVYDILELYRVFADIAIMSLLAEKKIKASDFVVTYESYTYRLKEHTAKLLISRLKEAMNQRALYKNKQNFTYQNILFNEVRKISRFLQSKQNKLEFNIPLIHIKRNDELSLRNRILSITPEERKKLGLNKSTVWYLQKHVKEDKKIKVYNKVRARL
jgi:CRISPR-associated protein Cas1